MSARYFDDSLKPEFDGPRAVPDDATEALLQVSINRALIRRLDALDKEVAELRRKVKNLEHMVPA